MDDPSEWNTEYETSRHKKLSLSTMIMAWRVPSDK